MRTLPAHRNQHKPRNVMIFDRSYWPPFT